MLAFVFLLMALGVLVATGQVDTAPNCPTVTYHGKCL